MLLLLSVWLIYMRRETMNTPSLVWLLQTSARHPVSSQSSIVSSQAHDNCVAEKTNMETSVEIFKNLKLHFGYCCFSQLISIDMASISWIFIPCEVSAHIVGESEREREGCRCINVKTRMHGWVSMELLPLSPSLPLPLCLYYTPSGTYEDSFPLYAFPQRIKCAAAAVEGSYIPLCDHQRGHTVRMSYADNAVVTQRVLLRNCVTQRHRIFCPHIFLLPLHPRYPLKLHVKASLPDFWDFSNAQSPSLYTF